MKKRSIVTAALCLSLLSGCAETPENAIVKKKTGQNIEQYKEVQQPEEKEAETENQEEVVRKNELASRLSVPQTYQDSGQSEDGRFQLVCEAKVEVPDVEKIGVYKVSQLPFDQPFIDKVTDAFFGDAPVYDGAEYGRMTKGEILEKLEELKKYQAEGNEDPYGLIAQRKEAGEEFDPEEVYSLQREIDGWEAEYQDAPEEVTKVPVTPALQEGYFQGVVEMNGEMYNYKLKTGAGDHMNIQIEQRDANRMWIDMDSVAERTESDPAIELPSGEEVKKQVGITEEEAITKAASYLEKMGLTDFVPQRTRLALTTEIPEEGENKVSYKEASACYMISFTRQLEGFPITWEGNYGGGLESMESTIKPWAYERVEIGVDQGGLCHAEILNLYQIGEKQVENVELKPFSEISEIFRQMILIKNADMEYDQTSKLTIDRVTLGYMRVYDPGADASTGLLVPVWDFFGQEEGQCTIEGETTPFSQNNPEGSFLTINGADGTVINRSLGY